MSGAAGIAAVVLAAGSSRRFGAENKLLATVAGQTLIMRVLAAIRVAGLSPIIVVTGHEAGRLGEAVAGEPVTLTHNPRHLDGIGTSIAAGVAAVPVASRGVLVAQGDMPALDGPLLAALVDAFNAAGGDMVVYPRLPDGHQGNPVIWPSRLFPALARLEGDRGGKRLLEREAGRAVAVPVAGDAAEIDIDTPEELARYLGVAGSSTPS